MKYTKPYYQILGLEQPSSPSQYTSHTAAREISAPQLRAKYRAALLAAHPDKNGALRGKWSVDDVKEAFFVLGDAERKQKFDAWSRSQKHDRQGDDAHAQGEDDFILGLEVLDLSDFEYVEGIIPDEAPPQDGKLVESVVGEEVVEWRRACRCGVGGFRITEEELERVDRRGEKEVLVGCEGCSLWVRVAFDVEEG